MGLDPLIRNIKYTFKNDGNIEVEMESLSIKNPMKFKINLINLLKCQPQIVYG